MPELLEKALDIALQAATESARSIRGYYQGDFEIEIKADQTPVTVADRAAEDIIRSVVMKAFPDHGFYGEEGGASHTDADYLWLVDPIDGTKSFVAGYGMFSTQIALMHRGRLVLGVSSAPVHHELAWAVDGQGAFLQLNNGQVESLRVSQAASVEQATVSTGNIQTLAKSDRWSALGAILGSANRTRGYGDYYHYHRLAAGQVDAVIESDVNILDIAALTVIVTEAGGLLTDIEGAAPGLNTRSVLAANPVLHASLLDALVTDSRNSPTATAESTSAQNTNNTLDSNS